MKWMALHDIREEFFNSVKLIKSQDLHVNQCAIKFRIRPWFWKLFFHYFCLSLLFIDNEKKYSGGIYKDKI